MKTKHVFLIVMLAAAAFGGTIALRSANAARYVAVPTIPAVVQTALASQSDNSQPKTKKDVLLESYVKISTALAADNLDAAKTAAAELSKNAGIVPWKELSDKADPVANATDIQTARGAFKTLSALIEPLATLAGGEQNFAVMYCSMQGADWIQVKGPTQNPYYGKAMLTCGSPKQAGSQSAASCGMSCCGG